MSKSETHNEPNHPIFVELSGLLRMEQVITNSSKIKTDDSFFSGGQPYINETRLRQIEERKEQIYAQCN